MRHRRYKPEGFQTVDVREIRAFVRNARPRFEALLKDFVEIPTVSADPAHRPDIERCLELAVETIRRFGGKPHVYTTRGYPLVHGAFMTGRDVPAVAIYNHLDVQPALRDDEPWETDPFTLVRRGDVYYGRGTTDDKGPAAAVLLAVVAAREAGIPLNIHLLWEFEEEIGSPHFEEGLSAAARTFQADSVVICDSAWISRGRPTSTAGFRGFQGFRFALKTAEQNAHSGDVGGAARNPLAELMGLMSEIQDPHTGEVKIPGFYDDVATLTEEDLGDFRASGFTTRRFKKDNHLKKLRTEDPLEILERTWARPTFEVHGVVGGYQGPGSSAIVPAEGEVKASCRLVPHQKPERIASLVKRFVKGKNPDVVVHAGAGALPFEGIRRGPYAEAIRRAFRFGFGREPAFVRDGGSLGSAVSLARLLRAPVLFLGISLIEHGYHAPNEHFDWAQASGGILAFTKYFEVVARVDKREGDCPS